MRWLHIRHLSALVCGALLAIVSATARAAGPWMCPAIEIGIVRGCVPPATGFENQTEWRNFCASIERALQRHLFDDLAWNTPRADLAAAFLGSVPEGSLFADELKAIGLSDAVAVDARLPAEHPGIATASTPANRAAQYRWSRPYWFRSELTQYRRPLFDNIDFWKRRVTPFAFPDALCALLPRLKAIFVEIGVPPELVWLMEIESAFDVDALSKNGARGLFQFMPATAKRFGLKVRGPDERINPEKAAFAAARYLRALHSEFGAWDLALAAYNAGEGLVRRSLKREGVKTFSEAIPYLPDQTQLYVMRVLATVAVRERCDPVELPPPSDDSPH